LLNNDFRDILSEFCAAGVEFVLVGAYAMAAHGLPRATGDIDLWVRCTPENAERVMVALARFGAPLHEIRVEDFHQPGIVFQIGVAPRRVDVLTEIDGVAFEEGWRDRVEIEVDTLSVPVLSRAHLLRNKRAAARPKDLADVAWLEAESPDS
jgi:nucleotidyltransferase AbiEii toxin of type IV toxin-antitoxin system